MNFTDYKDYRLFLKDELEKRIHGNSRYSLRAFARDLNITPQALSAVLKYKKGISLETAALIADRLELNPQEASYLSDLVTLAHSRSARARQIADYKIKNSSSANEYISLEIDAFSIISDWYHTAILELIETSTFKNDPKWISKRLDISLHETTQALGRLKKLELIEEDKNGHIFRTEVNLSASYGLPSSAIRKMNRQLLLKAADSLESQSLNERNISTITMAIDPERLAEAEKMIIQFRRKLAAFLEQGNRTEVYTFVPALFRISNLDKIKQE
jgi:uncharacterized protein (TIGR02147 family)